MLDPQTFVLLVISMPYYCGNCGREIPDNEWQWWLAAALGRSQVWSYVLCPRCKFLRDLQALLARLAELEEDMVMLRDQGSLLLLHQEEMAHAMRRVSAQADLARRAAAELTADPAE